MTEDNEPAVQPDLVSVKLDFDDRFDSLIRRSLTERSNDPAVHDGGAWLAKDAVSKPEPNNLIAPQPEPKKNPEF